MIKSKKPVKIFIDLVHIPDPSIHTSKISVYRECLEVLAIYVIVLSSKLMNMRKIGLLTLTLSFFILRSQAQKITGLVKDQQGKALANSTVSLLSAKDSAVVKLAASNPDGLYSFTDIKAGNYIISISHVGYAPVFSSSFENTMQETKVPALQLSKLTGEMKAVTVTSKKPMVEVKADKTIVNVEGTINSVGSDALELLRKSPGVTIDKDDNISLAGKNGVQVYIDGRPTPLSGTDLSAYLKSLQSGSIESIEIITNPSAKYDAAGNAGIINIRLKKNQAFGTNGSVNAGYGIGIYPKYNAGIAWNNRDKAINLFGNYNFNQNKNEMHMNLNRNLLDTLFDQKSTFTNRNESHNFKLGFDYYLNNKSIFGVMVNGNRNESTNGINSKTPISYIPTKDLNKTLVADNDTRGRRYNMNYNANYRFADTSGHELNVDADLGYFRLNNDQVQRNFYFDASGNPYDTKIYEFITPTDIDIYSLKTDYSAGKKGKIGIGGKISYVKTKNDFDRYDIAQGGKFFDSTRSNIFDYKENINALYFNYNTQAQNFMIQFGVRMENTMSEGRSNGFAYDGSSFTPSGSSFKRSYTDFFPSGAITYNKNPMSQWGLRYSRRIDRPAYQDLNPFEFKLDEYTYQKGNTDLRPQYTNSFAITHMYKYKLNSTLNYSHVTDVFTQLVDTTERSKSFLTKKNLATQDVFNVNVSYPFQYKTYSAFGNAGANYSHYKANFGPGRTVDLDAFSYNIYMQHSVKFKKVYTAEVSGWYNSPSLWGGTFKSKALWSVDAGLMRALWQGKANVKISVSDIFSSLRFQGTSIFAGQYLHVAGRPEATQFKINFTYRFGSNQVKSARQRSSGLEDENNRANSQSSGLGNQ
jgi:iron complex outermembrane receptor protein